MAAPNLLTEGLLVRIQPEEPTSLPISQEGHSPNSLGKPEDSSVFGTRRKLRTGGSQDPVRVSAGFPKRSATTLSLDDWRRLIPDAGERLTPSLTGQRRASPPRDSEALALRAKAIIVGAFGLQERVMLAQWSLGTWCKRRSAPAAWARCNSKAET